MSDTYTILTPRFIRDLPSLLDVDVTALDVRELYELVFSVQNPYFLTPQGTEGFQLHFYFNYSPDKSPVIPAGYKKQFTAELRAAIVELLEEEIASRSVVLRENVSENSPALI